MRNSSVREATEAYPEKMEANAEEIKYVMEHQEVSTQKAVVEIIRALKERYRHRHLAVGHCQQPKKWTQGDGGSWKKLAAAHRQMTGCAIPARRKGHHHQEPGRDNVARGDPRGQTLERRQWMHQEGSNGIWDQDLKEQLHLGNERTSNRIFRKALMLEIMKRRVEYTCDSINIPYRVSYKKRMSWHMAVMTGFLCFSHSFQENETT
jgi:hypothetical protein